MTEEMTFEVEQVRRHEEGTLVWSHVVMDALRKTQCLCFGCGRLHDFKKGDGGCPV
ncbi:unnamed protein product, partial [marine sediment metagenome]